MWTLQLLGGLQAVSPQRQLTRFRTQKAASLLAYLGFHLSAHPRETLIDMLWPEAEIETGRHNLSNALSFLRHALEPPGVPPGTVILADRFTVRLNPAAVTTDVGAFETAVRQAEQSGLSVGERVSLLEQAVELYKGPLLPGYYEEWIAAEALRLESRFVQAAVQLVPLLLQAGKREQALAYARRAVSADPIREEATLSLMLALADLGQPAQALRAYRQLETRLEEELDTRPSPALQHLAAQAGHSEPPPSEPAATRSAPASQAELVLAPAHPNLPGREEPAPDTAMAGSAPAGRLLGGEFLLRTTTRFFGREEEVARLDKMLSTPRTRLVTLTGPGGTGKTRLALEAAAHLVNASEPQDRPLSRAVFVSLAEVSEADRLFEVILRALGMVPVAGQSPLDQLAQALLSLPNTLLVLDNFEQLAEEGALLVRDLLVKAVEVKLLVTSRQKLHIEGERDFHLAPLPTTGGAQTLEELLLVPSIALFVDRAQAALPDFHLSERNAATVAALCDYLEGIPLAIELAAARVSVLSPARILKQVQADRLDFLTTRRRDAESRHKTLRATLDWSYRLLPEAGQRFLAQVSVFRGGWTLPAAQAVSALSEEQTLELLMALRDSSLIGVMDTKDGLRFILLETIREYSQDKLSVLGEDAAVHRRHRDYFAGLLAQAEPELTGPDQARWLDRLETEHDNLCAALDWCETDAESAQVGLWLAGALSRFWEIHGYLSLGRRYLARALSPAEASAPTAERAKALNGAGALALCQGDYGTARTQCEQALAIWRELADQAGIAFSLNTLGSVAYRQADYDAARTLFEESLAIRRELGDPWGIAVSLNTLGNIAYARSDFAAARTLLQESLAISRELGDKMGIADSLSSLGSVVYRQGDFTAARRLLQESLAISRELGDKMGIALSLFCLGDVVLHQSDYEEARTLLQESLALFRETGHSYIIYVLSLRGNVEREAGDYAQAAICYQESLLLRREQGDALTTAYSLEDFAGLAGRQGQYARAARLLGAAEALAATMGRTLPVANRAEYERTVEAAHADLSAEAFAAAWEQGRTMTMDLAIAYALAPEEAPPQE
jgi:predicted ATPase/DNA-binding SARP family transcriptional activator